MRKRTLSQSLSRSLSLSRSQPLSLPPLRDRRQWTHDGYRSHRTRRRPRLGPRVQHPRPVGPGPDPRRRCPGDVAVGGQRPGRSGRLHRVPGRKFTTFESTGSLVRVEVANTTGDTRGSLGRPCALIEQDGAALATVFFDVVGGMIIQISLGPYPPPESCLRSGAFPGFDEGDDLVN